MRRIVGSLIGLLLTVSLAPGLDTEAEAIVKRAIDAAGGAEALKKFPAARLTATGTLLRDENNQVPVTAEQVVHVPGRSRITMKLEPMGQKLEVLNIVNGTKARYVINGSPVPITDAARDELIAAMTTLEIGQLLPLLSDRKFILKVEKSPRGEGDTVSVLVHTKNHGDYRLGFDRTTGHLVRLTRKAYDATTGKLVDQEQLFTDFKLFENIARPTKVVVLQDGKKIMELAIDKYTPLASVEAKEFSIE